MTWEEIEKKCPKVTTREETDIDCPECGKKIFKRTDIVLTTYPEQYQYECECGWVGYAFV